jgi:hypothetical protein
MVSELHCVLPFMYFVNERGTGMKTIIVTMLSVMLLAACGKNNDNKPILHKDVETLNKAKDVNNMLQQQAQKQRQATDQQTQ